MYSIEQFSPADAGMDEFHAVAEALYAGDPYRRAPADPPSTPGARCLLVRKDGATLGRACVVLNPAMAYEGEPTALLGWYECADDDAAATALLDAAVAYGRGLGCRRLVGPINGSTWHSYRFAEPSGSAPFFLDVHNKEWYAGQFERYGLQTIARYYSSRFEIRPAEERVTRFETYYRERGITLRELRMEELDRDLRAIHTVSLAGFAENFLYTPLPFEEFRELYNGAERFLDPGLVLIAEDGAGAPLGFIFAVPNLYEQRVRSMVVKTVAVVPGGTARGLGTFLVELLHGKGYELGYREAIHALMHERNASTRVLADAGEPHRAYRLFGGRI